MQPIACVPESSFSSLHSPRQPLIRILSIGEDAMLLDSRIKVLRRAGYAVQPCTSQEALDWMRKDSFDVVLVCRSVSEERGFALAREMHTYWQAKVIRLAPLCGEAESLYAFAIDMTVGPERFLRILAQVLAGTAYGPTRQLVRLPE